MKFVLIPAGTFAMGSPPDEPGREKDEVLHLVTISRPFFMQTTEVTAGQWYRVMGEKPSFFQSCGKNCPVEKISWNEVQTFITRLNELEGTDTYRLPTEAEWEYACRAGSNGPVYKTQTIADHTGSSLNRIAWYIGNSCVDYPGGLDFTGWEHKQPGCSFHGPHLVGQKQPNTWGLYDMLGNVWEWCRDWYGPYDSDHVRDPKGPTEGEIRIFRGGSWLNGPRFCRAAVRDGFWPGGRGHDIGFRLAKSP